MDGPPANPRLATKIATICAAKKVTHNNRTQPLTVAYQFWCGKQSTQENKMTVIFFLLFARLLLTIAMGRKKEEMSTFYQMSNVTGSACVFL